MIFYKRRKFYAGRSFFFTMAKFFCVFIKTVVIIIIIIINILVDENDVVVITLSLSMSLRHGVNYRLRHNKNNTSFVKL